MGTFYLEVDRTGTQLTSCRASTGQGHRVVVRTLELDHRYHDDDPIHRAPFTVRLPNGLETEGTLDDSGRATVRAVPSNVTVTIGADQRDYTRVHSTANPAYRETMSEADFDALVAERMSESESG